MNLAPLFEAQRKLDEKIVKEKGLEGQDLLDKKILALQVELGELANEWRGFKFWSDNQTAITLAARKTGNGKGETYNPLLEEYVDCLHFILSIGNEFDCSNLVFTDFLHRENDITNQFKYVFYTLSSLDERIVCKDDIESKQEMYGYLFGGFAVLGKLLGFTWEQIEQAYFSKNKINHDRQANGY